jgi:hypothetical protein
MRYHLLTVANHYSTERNPAILQRWQNDGVLDDIKRRLGYRYQLVEATLANQVAAGSRLAVSVTLKNDGWAGVYNPRWVEVVLRNGTDVRRVRCRPATDERRWLPEAGETKVLASTLILPADLPAGPYEVLLHLPDPMPTLHDRPEYAIRLANQGTWEAATGFNKLGHTLQVTAPPATGAGTGLRYEHFTNPTLSGPAVGTGVDAQVDKDWGTGSIYPPNASLPADNFGCC